MAANKNIFVNIKVSSKKAEKNVKDVKEATDGLSSSVTILNKEQKKAAVVEQTAILRKKQQTEEIKRLAAANLQASQSTKQFKTQVGLNNAILTEAGRAASDLRFGFNGVANNVGQLASLFGSLINTSDNVLTSLTNLGKSFLGTGGILIGIQLLIAYGDRIYDFFVGTASAIDIETEALIKNNEELEKTIKKREILADLISQTQISFDETFLINFKNGLNLLEDTDIALAELSERFAAAGVENAKILADESIANDARFEIAIKMVELFKAENRLKELRKEQDDELLKGQQKGVEINELSIKQFSQDIIRKRKDIILLQKDIDRLSGRGIILTPDGEEDGATSLSDNLTQFLDLSKKIQAARADIRKGTAIDDMDAIRIQGENEEAALEAQAKVFLDKQKQRLEQKLITQEQYNESEKQAEQELSDAILATREKTINREINLRGRRNEIANQLNIDSFKIREELLLNEEIIGDENLGRIAGKRLKFTQDNLNQEIDGLRARLESEQLNVQQRAELQKQLSQAELKESNIRIKIADAEAQAKIESLNLVSSALSVASKIAGENSKVGKALAVSAALITTYTSANKAYLSQFSPIPTASSPVRGALASAVAVASGLMNVKKILSVNPKGQSNVGGGGGATVQAPNFNVVGASSTNQLAQAVGEQVNEPIRAYVVGSDVTNQQELDRRIVDTAGIG